MKYRINCHGTANNINSRMNAKGMNIANLADYLDISTAAIYKWSTGKTKPSLEVLASLSILFDVTINELIEVEEEQ